jgi:hypothetical protein
VDSDTLDHVTQVLQLSITPVALISGVGLLLLTVTNRLGRVIDRARALAEHQAGTDQEIATRRAETLILRRRSRLLLFSIALIATSIFLAVLMVVALFLMNLSGAALGTMVLILFGACLVCLAASMGYFMGDIFLSIRWLRISLGEQ